MMTNRTFAIILLLGVASMAASTTSAQRAGGMGRMPTYDTKTETTLAGTIEEVKTVSGMMGHTQECCPEGAMQGTHIMLKTNTETIEVHVGPSAFLKEHKLEFVKGDQVKVVGSRMTVGGSAAVVAREIQKGETTLALRDANGRPFWRMGHR